jgi:hypothetical protein
MMNAYCEPTAELRVSIENLMMGLLRDLAVSSPIFKVDSHAKSGEIVELSNIH